MPNRPIHVLTSGAVGLLYSMHRSREEPEAAKLFEAIGGTIGGIGGGRMPDLIDLPTSPRHRGRAHSFTAGAAVIRLCEVELEGWQDALRARAGPRPARAQTYPAGSIQGLLYILAAGFLRFLAGLIAGFLAGYLTHLALDACTPSCLNLI